MIDPGPEPLQLLYHSAHPLPPKDCGESPLAQSGSPESLRHTGRFHQGFNYSGRMLQAVTSSDGFASLC